MSRIPIRLPGAQRKYRNTPTDGFASKREAIRHGELELLVRLGKIAKLEKQVRYELIPAQGPKRNERAVFYVADFVYFDLGTRSTVVEDCKGKRTQVYILKRKLMRFRYGIEILET